MANLRLKQHNLIEPREWNHLACACFSQYISSVFLHFTTKSSLCVCIDSSHILPSRSKMSFRQLDNFTLLNIFKRLPMSALLRAHQVCTRWHTLANDVFLHQKLLTIQLNNGHGYGVFELPSQHSRVISGKISSLLGTDASLWISSPMDDLCAIQMWKLRPTFLPSCTELPNRTEWFGQHLPAVRSLSIFQPHCDERELDSILKLIQSFQEQLCTLKLWLRFSFTRSKKTSPCESIYSDFFNTLNSIPQLSHISLDLSGGFHFEVTTNFINDWSILFDKFKFLNIVRTAQLFIRSTEEDPLMKPSTGYKMIRHFYDSPILRQLNITVQPEVNQSRSSEYTDANYTLQWLYSRSGRKVSKVVAFPGKTFRFQSVEQMNIFADRFDKLTTLNLWWERNITFHQIVNSLSELSTLTHLGINCPNYFHAEQFKVHQPTDKHKQMSLCQVKVLQFRYRQLSHHDFDTLSPVIFPSVRTLSLVHINRPMLGFMHKCTQCGTNFGSYKTDATCTTEQWNRCMDMCKQSLKTILPAVVKICARVEEGICLDDNLVSSFGQLTI